MKQHWWSYTRILGRKQRDCIIEVCVYGSMHSMRRGILRHKAAFNRDFPDWADPFDKNIIVHCSAMCRSWSEVIEGHSVPVSRLFFCKPHFTPGIIAHEALHAALAAERRLTHNEGRRVAITTKGGPNTVSEEATAVLVESFVRDILAWSDAGFPDEAMKGRS